MRCDPPVCAVCAVGVALDALLPLAVATGARKTASTGAAGRVAALAWLPATARPLRVDTAEEDDAAAAAEAEAAAAAAADERIELISGVRRGSGVGAEARLPRVPTRWVADDDEEEEDEEDEEKEAEFACASSSALSSAKPPALWPCPFSAPAAFALACVMDPTAAADDDDSADDGGVCACG